MYGCDCYAYSLLAAGHCDLVVEADLKPYDYMAQVPIIEGAGGVITDWQVVSASRFLLYAATSLLGLIRANFALKVGALFF